MARRKRYSAEFKRQALRRANEAGMTDALVCEELGVSTRQLRRWREAVQEHGDENAFPGHGNEERDFLKDAARYFAKESK
jgi:transposase